MSKHFQFGPQPALDKAIDHQKAAEEAVAAARRELDAEKRKLAETQQQVDQTTQQIRLAHDKLIDPARKASDPRELDRHMQFLDALKARREHQLALLRQQAERVAWAEQKLELRKQELAEAMAQVQALETLKEKRRTEHEREQQKREEKQREDEAIQRWNAERTA